MSTDKPESKTTRRPLTESEMLILSFGTTGDGAMADPIADATLEDCERLVSEGLLSRGPDIEYIRTYHTTAAGIRAIGGSVS